MFKNCNLWNETQREINHQNFYWISTSIDELMLYRIETSALIIWCENDTQTNGNDKQIQIK